VQTLGLVLSVKDSFRLGFLGLMLNLAPMGIVGGDLVKGYLIAKKNPNSMSQAVASVIVDRIIGLLVMFLCGAFFVVATGFAFRQEMLARTFSQLVFLLTGIGYACVGIVFLPFFAKGHVERLLAKIPFCGNILGKLTQSLLLYRNHKICLLKTFALTFFVHIPFGVSLYLIAKGLFGSVPNLIDHIMLYNVVNLTAMIPLAAGPFEFVLEQVYPLFEVNGLRMGVGIGLVVALGYRLISILVAGLGIVYYLSSRDELKEIAN
ncbi:MAG: flippase-like domain-containing protein, partial [Planctomycetaceae bacterium]|nr:flippase-like domain-containing protein [Planctomycetaceae bacterium]